MDPEEQLIAWSVDKVLNLRALMYQFDEILYSSADLDLNDHLVMYEITNEITNPLLDEQTVYDMCLTIRENFKTLHDLERIEDIFDIGDEGEDLKVRVRALIREVLRQPPQGITSKQFLERLQRQNLKSTEWIKEYLEFARAEYPPPQAEPESEPEEISELDLDSDDNDDYKDGIGALEELFDNDDIEHKIKMAIQEVDDDDDEIFDRYNLGFQEFDPDNDDDDNIDLLLPNESQELDIYSDDDLPELD